MELVGQSKPEKVGTLFKADPDIAFGYTDVNLGEHNLAAPLLQIFSVRVHTMFDDGKPCEIYGSIQATDGQGTNFELYGRDVSEAETVWKHGSLTLIDPKDHAILGVTRVALDLDLKDRIRDIQLVKKRYYLESATEGVEDSNEKLKIGVVQGECSVAYVYYMAFRFATSTTVEIDIVDKGDGSDVYGSLVASYSNSRQYCNTDDELKHLETVLFEKPSNQPVRMVSGTPVKLRSVMAVPAYSSIVINADLFESRGQFVSGRKVFPAQTGCEFIDSIQSKNGCLHVNVKFKNPYPRIYKDRQLKGCTSASVAENLLYRESNESSKRARVLGFPKSYSFSSSILNRDVFHNQKSRVEIFSVYIGGIDRTVHALSGKVDVYEPYDPIDIYYKDMNDVEVLSEDRLVPIGMNFVVDNEVLCLSVDLKDPTQNLEISKGHISWLGGNISEVWGMSWYDKRICSVIRGANGYAAFHYMIINIAVRAKVEVVFHSENCVSPPNIYGTLYAYYGGHEYYSDYDKKFNRSRLFQRSRNKAAILGSSEFPLMKSVVAVPGNTSLIIEADLKVFFDDSSSEEVVCDKKEFPIDMSSTTCKEFRGQASRFKVSVEFA